MYEVRLEKKAKKELENLPASARLRILKSLTALSGQPGLGKALKGELVGLYSYRVWPYRIFYKVYKEVLVVIVLHIAHRQGVYD